MFIGFKDFYNKVKGIVDEVNPSSKISSLSADKSSLVYSALNNNEKKKLVVVNICQDQVMDHLLIYL